MLKTTSTLFLIIIANSVCATMLQFEQKPLPYEQGSISYDVQANATLMSAFGATNKQISLFKDYGKTRAKLYYKDEKLLSRMVLTPTKMYTFFPKIKKYSLDIINKYPGLAEFQTVYNELNKRQKINYKRFIAAAEIIESFEDEDKSEIFIPAYRYQGNICKLVIDKYILEDENLTRDYDYNCYLDDDLPILSKTQPIKEFNIEKKPAEHFFDIKIPANYTKIDSIMQGFSKLVEQNEDIQIPPQEEIKKHMLEIVNNEAKIKRMEAKAENIINYIKPHIENYMELVLNGKRAQTETVKNQQTDGYDSSSDNQQSSKSDEPAGLQEKVIEAGVEAGLDLLGSFF